MKKAIHPISYRKVVFEDATSGARFLIGSTIPTKQSMQWDDGVTYPLVKVEISSASHPFYTGKETIIDSTGRVEKFKKRTAAAKTLSRKSSSTT